MFKSVYDSFSLLEDGKTVSSRNVVFSGYLEFRTLDKVLKPFRFTNYEGCRNAVYPASAAFFILSK
jgi:hypothetical protein